MIKFFISGLRRPQWLLLGLFCSLSSYALAQPPCDDDDDDDLTTGSLELVQTVCAGDDITLTFFFTSDDDPGNLVVDVSYSIGGQNFTLNGIGSGTQVSHPVLSSTTATLLTLYNPTDGCVVTLNASIPIPVWPQPNLAIANQSNPSCGQSNGSVALSASGGTAPLQYRINGGNLQTNPNFGGLPAGSYTFEVVDANGCTDATTTTLISANGPNLAIANQSNPSCGQSNGSVALSASGGTAPLQYRINGGNLQTSPNFSGLPPGSYTFEVVDANGCTDATTTTLLSANGPNLTIANQNNPSCGQSNGSVALSASGGTAPLQYRINGGNLQTSPNFSGLPPGSYTFEVVDANGCTDATTTTLLSANGPNLTIANQSNPSCGQSNGSVALSASGGTAPLQYRINGGNLQTSPNFSGLPAGSYTFEVIDANGCTDATTTTLLSANGPNLTIANQSNPSCGQSNGSVALSASGGTAPLQYRINGGNLQNSPNFSGLPAGSYTFEVVDDNGCTDVTTTTLISANGPNLTIANQSNPSCGQSNGSVALSASGGTAPLQYRINGGNLQTSPNFSGLPAGSYTFEVVDANGCSDFVDLLLSNQSTLTLTIEIIQLPSCADDGQIRAIGSGGQGPYSYSIDGGLLWQSSPLFGALSSGTYVVEVRDAAGCLSFTTVELDENNGALPDAQIEAGSQLELCLGEWYELAGSTAPGVSFQWYSSSPLIDISDPTAAITEIQATTSGGYWLYYELSTPLCPAYSLDSLYLLVLPPPVAQTDGPLQINPGNTLTINVLTNDQSNNGIVTLLTMPQAGTLSQNGNGLFRYQAAMGQGAIQDTFFYLICHPICASYCDTGMVILSISADDTPEPDPCDLSQVPDNVLPEGLTLNNDGYNDRLEFVIIDASTCPFNNLGSELIIFNRWGDKVFEQSPYDNNWDGVSSQGQRLPPGVYYYVLKVNLPDQEPFIRFKNVTIFY